MESAGRDKLKRHAQVESAPLDSFRNDVPQGLVAIASRMMAKDPDERYLTLREVANALESFLRTWQPGQAASQAIESSGAGNMSGSGRNESRDGIAGWDWRFVLASIFVGIAGILVSLISYEAWNFDPVFSHPNRYRVAAYLLATPGLSLMVGILYRRSNSALRPTTGGVRGRFGLTATEALALVAVLPAVLFYAQGSNVTLVRGQGKVVPLIPQEQLHTVKSPIKSGDELFTIGPHTWESAVELWISGDDMPHVQQGDRVRLQFEGWPTVGRFEFFDGEVLSIAPHADDTGNFRVLIKEDSNSSWPDTGYLRPGVRANCWVITETR